MFGIVLKIKALGLLFVLALSGLAGCSREIDNSDEHIIPPSSDAFVDNILLSVGKLDQGFALRTREYTALVDYLTTSIQIIPVYRDKDGEVTVEGQLVAHRQPSQLLPLKVGNNTIKMRSLSADRRNHIDYEIVITRQNATTFADDAYFKALNAGADDQFGYSLAQSGTTMVVGAYHEDSGVGGVNNSGADNSASASGAVYVFDDGGGDWIQQAYIKALETGVNDHFGYSVAIDGNTLVVGAPGEASGVVGDRFDNSAPATGAAYVFTRTDKNWTQRAYLKASNMGLNDNFGWNVAIDGDWIAISAIGEDSAARGINGEQTDDCGGTNLNCATDSGAVYLFKRSFANSQDTVGVWTQQAYIKASNTAATDRFGYRLAMDDTNLIVGAPNQDTTNTDSGAAYVFVRSGDQWSQQAFLKAAVADASDQFGSSVDIWQHRAVIGAVGEDGAVVGINQDPNDNAAAESGAVYVFNRSGSTWSQHSYIKPKVVGAGDQFGYSVSLDVDVLLVGAPYEDSFDVGINGNATDNTRADSGAGYLFLESSNAWAQQFYLKPLRVDSQDFFGGAVAVHSGVAAYGSIGEANDQVGIDRTVINNNLSLSGAVYTFR